MGVIAGQAAIFSARLFTGIGFLWYNVIGAVVVVATGLGLSYARAGAGKRRRVEPLFAGVLK